MIDTTNKWQRRVDRLASISLIILIANVTFGIIMGTISVLTWNDPPWTVTSWRNLTFIFATFMYLTAIILTLPSLILGIVEHIRGQWSPRAIRWLTFVGALLVPLGFEGLSHWAFDCNVTPWACRYEPDWGFTIYGKWHLLHHSLVAILPLVLYWLALGKWHPSITQFKKK
jgi:hypothetical protein